MATWLMLISGNEKFALYKERVMTHLHCTLLEKALNLKLL